MPQNENFVEYSVVIPVYNSEKTLGELASRLVAALKEVTNKYEIIFVDDCSTDGSWDKLKEIHDRYNNIRIIHLLRNFGQHSALVCGLSYASGEYIVMMDDDLQNPPEEIPKLIQKIKEGYLVVYGKYLKKMHNKSENFLSAIFHKFIHYILDIPNEITISNFVIINHDVARNMTKIKSAYPFITALIARSTPLNKITNVEVKHDERKVGKSNYNFIKYLKTSLDLFINYSSLPLTVLGLIGFFLSIASIVYGLTIITRKIIDPGYGLMGWSSLMVAVSLMGGAIMMSLAIFGEYLRRIIAEVSYAQPYVIGEMHV